MPLRHAPASSDEPDRIQGVVFWNRLILFLLNTVDQLLGLYFWIVLIAVLLTWVNTDPYNPIVRFLHAMTEPVFDFVREHIPTVFGGIDLSPIVVVFAIGLLRQVVLPGIAQYLPIGYPSPAFG
jgi:YggT family protein